MATQTALYGDTPAYELPTYTRAEASRYLGIPVSTVTAWTKGMPYTDRDGFRRMFRPVIIPAGDGSLSFQNLVELFVLKSIRRVHEVTLDRVRNAVERLRFQSGSEHPLADYEILTDRKDLLIEQFGKLYNLVQNGQQEIKEVVETCLHHIQKDPAGTWVYRPIEHVELSPERQFGKPCIRGTRIPTEIVYVRRRSGETVSDIAEDLECRADLVAEAIEYESGIRQAA